MFPNNSAISHHDRMDYGTDHRYAAADGLETRFEYDVIGACVTHVDYRDDNGNPIDTLTYTYDAKGQRITKSGGPGSVPETPFAAEYNAADRMTRITLYHGTENEATYQLDYDAEGNLTRKQNTSDPTDTTLYSWDARNRLTALSAPTITASFRYDALNRRIERTVNGTTLRAIYDGPQLIGEITSGVIDTTYLTGLQIDEMLARYTDAGQRTYLTDTLGTVIAQTRDDQTPINWYAYSPYGEVTTIGDDEGNPVQYTGRENDHTGLYYYRARYYDPVLKRFIARDPIGLEGGINSYAYVENNPLNYIDPLGLDLTIAYDTDAARGAGHLGIGVNSNNTEGRYPGSDVSPIKIPFSTVPGIIKPDDPGKTDATTVIPLTPQQDDLVKACINNKKLADPTYNLYSNSCVDLVRDCVKIVGVSISNSMFPQNAFCSLVKKYGCSGDACNECQ